VIWLLVVGGRKSVEFEASCNLVHSEEELLPIVDDESSNLFY
jgi:hypothetical protein